MKICIISKYPPIEGGVSSHIYWLAKALGERGHKIFVVTNALEVESEYKEEITKEDLCYLEPKNVKFFSTTPNEFRSPILKSDYYTERLSNLAIDVVKNYDVDLIYSHYLLPYSIVGFITKKVTNRPHIIRHAGSDIGRLYKSKFLKTIFLEVSKDADLIFGNHNFFNVSDDILNPNKFISLQRGVSSDFDYGVEPFDLSRYVNDKDTTIFSYFGKISEMKKTYAFVEAASKIKEKKFKILFVIGNNPRVQKLKGYLSSINLIGKCIFLPFQPPWKIPSLIKASTCVVSPEDVEPPPLKKGVHHPIIPREAMACGKCVIVGKGVSVKGIYPNITDKKDFLVVNPSNINEFKDTLEYVINNPQIVEEIGKNAYKSFKKNEDFKRKIDKVEEVFSSIIKNIK